MDRSTAFVLALLALLAGAAAADESGALLLPVLRLPYCKAPFRRQEGCPRQGFIVFG